MKVEKYAFDDNQLTIGILSDSHGVTDAAVVDVMAQCDLAVHAGDVMAHAAIAGIKNSTRTLAVAGNNDSAGLQDPDSEQAAEFLPDVILLELPSGTIAVEHGHRHGFHQPEHQKLIEAHPGVRAIVYGHTHRQIIDQTQTPWILNPGAAGHVRNHGGPKCLVLHVEAGHWRIVSHNF